MNFLHTLNAALIYLILTSSTLAVINGVPIDESEFSEVVRLEVHLYNQDRELFIGDCEATAITPRHFITAAHCFNNSEGYLLDHGYIRYSDRSEKFTLAQTFSHPNFKKSEPSYATDLALITFDRDIADSYAPLATTPLKFGDGVRIVGHGYYDIVDMLGGDYTKRMGTNIFQPTELAEYFFPLGTIELQGYLTMQEDEKQQGLRSNCGPGDSGGPLFNELSELIGVCKAGVALNETTSTSIYTDLLSSESQIFFEKAAERGISIPQ